MVALNFVKGFIKVSKIFFGFRKLRD